MDKRRHLAWIDCAGRRACGVHITIAGHFIAALQKERQSKNVCMEAATATPAHIPPTWLVRPWRPQ
jgi:hypothetical protein